MLGLQDNATLLDARMQVDGITRILVLILSWYLGTTMSSSSRHVQAAASRDWWTSGSRTFGLEILT